MNNWTIHMKCSLSVSSEFLVSSNKRIEEKVMKKDCSLFSVIGSCRVRINDLTCYKI